MNGRAFIHGNSLGPLDLTTDGAYVHNVKGEYTRVAELDRQDGWIVVTVEGYEIGHVRDNGMMGYEATRRYNADTYQILGNRTTVETALSLLLNGKRF